MQLCWSVRQLGRKVSLAANEDVHAIAFQCITLRCIARNYSTLYNISLYDTLMVSIILELHILLMTKDSIFLNIW